MPQSTFAQFMNEEWNPNAESAWFLKSTHGTTIIGIINGQSIYLAADTMGQVGDFFQNADGEWVQQEHIDMNAEKLFQFENGIVAAVSGNSVWYNHILGLLSDMLEENGILTPSICAEFTHYFLNNPGDFIGGLNAPPGFDINDLETCDILFAGFVADPNNEGVLRPSLFCGSDDRWVEIVDIAREPDDLPDEAVPTFLGMGSGGDYAEEILEAHTVSLANGRLSQNVHAIDIVRAMREAFHRDEESGGNVIVAHLTRDGCRVHAYGNDLEAVIRRLKRVEFNLKKIRKRMFCKLNRFRRGV